MSMIVDATLEGGVLRLKQPVALAEGDEVRVIIRKVDEGDDAILDDPLAGVIGIGDSSEAPTDGAENHDKYLYGRVAGVQPRRGAAPGAVASPGTGPGAAPAGAGLTPATPIDRDRNS
ncbi:MAG: hypothetical protein JWN86_3109 [Planctomycetota bacterium]|nr:hypothetical protein [Planctomycetota bacterium]